MAAVTYDHVVKRYTADLTVVKDFNVEIKDKEFMVLVGPSGCGKSTALRMLAGLETISEGQIRIGERVVNDIAAKDRDIAMVFQSYALYPHMSVYDNMAFGLKMRGTPKPQDGHSSIRDSRHNPPRWATRCAPPEATSGPPTRSSSSGAAPVFHKEPTCLFCCVSENREPSSRWAPSSRTGRSGSTPFQRSCWWW